MAWGDTLDRSRPRRGGETVLLVPRILLVAVGSGVYSPLEPYPGEASKLLFEPPLPIVYPTHRAVGGRLSLGYLLSPPGVVEGKLKSYI